MNVAGAGFPLNPLTTETISPAFAMNCANTVSLTTLATWSINLFYQLPKPTQHIVTSMSMANFTPTVTVVTGFSVSQNFCIVMNTPEDNVSDGLSIYPNPANDRLFIKDTGSEINEIRFYNVNGKEVFRCGNIGETNISGLAPGIYLIKISTGKGILNKKFVKE